METDWIVDSFDDISEALDVVEVDRNEPWETIPYFHDAFSPQLILGIFPSYLQIDLRFYRAVRALPMSALSVAQEQMQAGLALIEPLSIGGIVLTESAVEACLKNLSLFAPDANPYMQIILSPSSIVKPMQRKNTFFEVHNVPSVVLLYQCVHLGGSDTFHPSGRFNHDIFPRRVSIEKKNCACGNTTSVRLLS